MCGVLRLFCCIFGLAMGLSMHSASLPRPSLSPLHSFRMAHNWRQKAKEQRRNEEKGSSKGRKTSDKGVESPPFTIFWKVLRRVGACDHYTLSYRQRHEAQRATVKTGCVTPPLPNHLTHSQTQTAHAAHSFYKSFAFRPTAEAGPPALS